MSQATVSGITNIKLQDFLNVYQKGSPRVSEIEWGPGTSLGTFVTVKDSRGRRTFYLITDVIPPSKASATHGHVPNSLNPLGITLLPADFTTSSTTPVAIPNWSQIVSGRNASQGLQALFLANAVAKVSAGTGFLDIFVDGTDNSVGMVITSLGFQSVSCFLAVGPLFSDGAAHTFELRGYVDAAIHTLTVQASSDTGLAGSYLTAGDLGTGAPIG